VAQVIPKMEEANDDFAHQGQVNVLYHNTMENSRDGRGKLYSIWKVLLDVKNFRRKNDNVQK
jgi:hypothetical protein